MSWTEKTWHRGGGDMPLDSYQFYRYRFRDQKRLFFVPYKVKFTLPFDAAFKDDPYHASGAMSDHHIILQHSPFEIRGRNVMDWAFECVTKGQAEFNFEVDSSFKDSFEVKSICTLHAKFGDKGIASLFKLTFG